MPLAHGPRPNLSPVPTPPARATNPEEKLRCPAARRAVEWTLCLRLQLGRPSPALPAHNSALHAHGQGRASANLHPLSRDPPSLPKPEICTQLRATDLLCRVSARDAKPTGARRAYTSFSLPTALSRALFYSLLLARLLVAMVTASAPRQPLIGRVPDRGGFLLVSWSREAPTRRRFGKTYPRGTWRSTTWGRRPRLFLRLLSVLN